MTDTAKLVATFEAILTEVLAKTLASRTTLRLDWPACNWDVGDVVAEARAPGVKSFKGDRGLDQRATTTVKWMEREHRILVQDDCYNCDPPAPPALLQHYGVKAQMLGPIIRNDHVQGWVSVHYVPSARTWTGAEIGALEAAVQKVHRELDALE